MNIHGIRSATTSNGYFHDYIILLYQRRISMMDISLILMVDIKPYQVYRTQPYKIILDSRLS